MHGEKMRLEREKMAALAEKMKAENKKMTKIQEDAWKLVNEGGALRVDELPSAYLKAKAKIELDGMGVCGKCRYSSGCMECNVWKCTAYWMRKEGKRLGRKIPHSLITYTVHSCSFCFAKIVGGLVPWETGSMLTYRHPEHGPFGTTRSIETDVFAQILSYDYGRGQN